MRGKYQRRRLARRAQSDIYVIDGELATVTATQVAKESWTIGEDHRPALNKHSVPKLREIAKKRGVAFTTRTRKADLIDLIVGHDV